MDALIDAIGLGVAGNMTGHLEQAGEASDFVGIGTADAPKGIFPWYVPGAEGRLGEFPLSSHTLYLPADGAPVQLEPEVALVCALIWGPAGLVGLRPKAFGAFDDCSRRVSAQKISEKKSWGPHTKGLSQTLIPIDHLQALDRWRLACFLVRDGVARPYGVDSEVRGYAYFHDRLLDWMVDRLRFQPERGPLEDLGTWLQRAGRPARAVIGIGATRYTPFGEQNMVQPGDESWVIVYDGDRHQPEAVARQVAAGGEIEGASVLRREVKVR